ncbi:hypothetical protein EV356DRAFT_498334 [Viridothelium virens]|uniref:ER lumen protein retaining receptor n=1 Tax=Viridothelium virens TaxID=1048519 RepID=A0A6A6HE28_VIRVR|nr:hypothetical protein EV356DRAFT_498334 [Viridothelium virens]
MAYTVNAFRVAGDVSHALSKVILIWAIHWNRSAEGVSLITQTLYTLVFVTRYSDLWLPHRIDLPSPHHALWYWNLVLKLLYIATSLYTVVIMMKVFARTREREKAWKMGTYCLGAAIVSAPFICMTFEDKQKWTFFEMLWTFSIILESVCVLPQLLLLRQTTVPTVIDSYYLVTLGSYRAFYILNWIVRVAKESGYWDPISWIFGVVQTALYLDFAWVYWTRQRVKLRGGGIVDSEDLSRGWLVSRLIGPGRQDLEDEERQSASNDSTEPGNGSARTGSRSTHNKWGPRGISVSADESVAEANDRASRTQDTKLNTVNGYVGHGQNGADGLADPSAFEDDIDSTDERHAWNHEASGETGIRGVGNGAEWRE